MSTDMSVAAAVASPYLNVLEAAEFSKLSEDSIRRMLASGKLTAYRPLRGRVLILRDELDSVIRASTTPIRKRRGRHAS